MAEENDPSGFSEDDALAEKLANLIGTTPNTEEKQNAHTFLNKVAQTKDTTKVGNVNNDELGMPQLTVRANKEIALLCTDILRNDYFAAHFSGMSEITTATSLSRNAKLIELAVSQRREFADATKQPQKENSGWFKKKSPEQTEQ